MSVWNLLQKMVERAKPRSKEDNQNGVKRKKGLLKVIILLLAITIAIIWLTSQHSLLNTLGSDCSYYGDKISDGEEFDYIVVGAGTAGSVVAARLAMAGMRVMLVEAGGDPNVISKIPGLAMTFLESKLDWNYETLSNNKSCLAFKGQACPFSRGRCVGGSSSINFMMYIRGNRKDYEFNITGWTWKDIEPYFLKYEGLYDLHRLPESSALYHNTSGIMPIGFFGGTDNPWHDRIIESMESLNIRYNPDVNAKSQIGVSQVLGYTTGGERITAAKAYLEQERLKGKLKLVKNTKCAGVIIDENNVARGVKVMQGDDKILHLYAKREIILSAGAIATPQLLMLSGVGPKSHLEQLGITVKADLAVGKGMADHVLPVVYIKVVDEYTNSSLFSLMGSKGLQIAQWFSSRSGPMTSISLTDLTVFLNTKCYNYTRKELINDRPECELPNLQLIHAFAYSGAWKTSFVRPALRQKRFYPQNDELFDQIFPMENETSLIVVAPVILSPESRGFVQLRSTNPLDSPAITPNYLDQESDLEEMVRALRFLEHVVETPIYKRFNATILYLSIPGCPAPGENGYLECYARHMTLSAHHAVGTAALGKVVDERLRVKGIKNLRVADASVLPHLPRGNTAAAVIAIGERLSDFLLHDNRLD